MRPTLSLLLVFLLVFAVLPRVESSSQIFVSLSATDVSMRLTFNVFQNVSLFPYVSSELTDVFLSNATEAIRRSVNSIDPKVQVASFRVSFSTNATWMNVTAQFTVSGVAERRGDILHVNLMWKSFTVKDDLKFGNFSYNLFGRWYVRPLVADIANQTKPGAPPNTTYAAATFFLNKTSVASNLATNRAGNATLFDFAPLRRPVALWDRTYHVENHTTSWRFDPGPVIDLTVRAQKRTGNQTLFFRSDLRYAVSISVPGIAYAEGNFVKMDVSPGVFEGTMFLVIVLLSAGAAAVHLQMRKLRRRIRMRRR